MTVDLFCSAAADLLTPRCDNLFIMQHLVANEKRSQEGSSDCQYFTLIKIVLVSLLAALSMYEFIRRQFKPVAVCQHRERQRLSDTLASVQSLAANHKDLSTHQRTNTHTTTTATTTTTYCYCCCYYYYTAIITANYLNFNTEKMLQNSSSWEHITELRSVTYHMGSHSVICCHPTHTLTPARQSGTGFTCTKGMDV